MLTESFQKLVIEDPLPDIAGNIRYGDCVLIDRDTTPVADISEIWGVIEDQCEASLMKVMEMRGEIPVAIHLYTLPHPEKAEITMFGWSAWTLKP